MTAYHAPSPLALRRDIVSRHWRRNPPLAALVLGMLAVMAIALIGLAADPRIITGAPAWMKPLKFAISIAVYGATLSWLLSFVTDRPRVLAIVSWGIGLGLAFEMVLIAMQVVRGTTSHFNEATPFDTAVWAAMGATIVAVWFLSAVIALLLARRRFAASPIVWGVRLGLVAALVGMAVAFPMTQETPQQDAFYDATGTAPIVGAHSVGVEDGGPGLPIVGWSTLGGDLRVGHFVGLHGLQALPLLGLILVRFGPVWMSMRDRSLLVGIAGLAWIGLTALLTWQALRGRPVVAPDNQTLAALAGLLGLYAIAAGTVVALARRSGSAACGRDAG